MQLPCIGRLLGDMNETSFGHHVGLFAMSCQKFLMCRPPFAMLAIHDLKCSIFTAETPSS